MSKLAIDGGEKIFNEPFPGWPSFEESTIQKAAESFTLYSGLSSRSRPRRSVSMK